MTTTMNTDGPKKHKHKHKVFKVYYATHQG